MILCENPGDKFHARVRFSNRKPEGSINVSLDAQAKDDLIQTSLNWGNSSAVTYSGKLAAATHFIRTQAEDQNKKAFPLKQEYSGFENRRRCSKNGYYPE